MVNALSEWVEVRVRRDEGVKMCRFERGFTTAEGLRDVEFDEVRDSVYVTQDDKNPGSLETRRLTKGSTVTFAPDATVFKSDDGMPNVEFSKDRLEGRMDELAYLNYGLTLTLTDMRVNVASGNETSR